MVRWVIVKVVRIGLLILVLGRNIVSFDTPPSKCRSLECLKRQSGIKRKARCTDLLNESNDFNQSTEVLSVTTALKCRKPKKIEIMVYKFPMFL